MDGRSISYKERFARHRITNIQKFLPIVEKEFGKDGAKEYINHIEDDYENNIILKIWKILKGFLIKR